MLIPGLLAVSNVMEHSGYSEEELFDLGISGELRFMVVVPELGACRVPEVALSHLMSGAEFFNADRMPEHWTGSLSGPWRIQRGNLRIVEDDWNKYREQAFALAAAVDSQSTAAKGFVTLNGRPVASLFQLVDELARSLCWTEYQSQELKRRAVQDATAGRVTMRDSIGLPVRSNRLSCVESAPDVLYVTDFNSWLESIGLRERIRAGAALTEERDDRLDGEQLHESLGAPQTSNARAPQVPPTTVPNSPGMADSDDPRPTPASKDSQPLQRFPAQESKVLSVIRSLHHDPARLPPRQPGKRWVKADVWEAIGVCSLFASEKVFDKAWERLRETGSIAERPGL